MKTIEEYIYLHSLSSPDKTALIMGDDKMSYAGLWDKILKSARFFQSKGFAKGDRVILAASKNIEFVYTYFGAHMAGMICVPIDSETNALRLKRIYACSSPRLIVGELRYGQGYETLPFPLIESDTEADCCFPDKDDTADLMFTTGTTGLPKGVELSFENESAAMENINQFIGNTSADIELLALPVSHSFGLGRLRCVLAKGATLVLLGSFASMKKFYAAIENYGVTGFGMVPASWAYISKMSGDKIARYSDQIKYIEIGSAAMSRGEKERLMSLLPQTRICMHYGLTEASRSAFISFHDETAHIDSVGKASPNVEIQVFDEMGNRVGSGVDGEICVKGEHVCVNYWGETEEAFRRDFFGSFFKTGDWGSKDDEGYIHLKSRKKEMINVGGKKVNPLEVEEALMTIPGINDAACIGVNDNVMGEVVKAFVVGRLGVEDNEKIRNALQGILENYKVPVEIEHVGSLPRTSNGKLQRLKLK